MQLGLWIEIRPADDLPQLTDKVAAMGFALLQAHFPAGCDRALARRLGRAAAASGLSVVAVSGYANPLRPAEAPMGSSLADLAGLIELMPMLGAHILVSWSGTYGAGLLDDHPENRSAAAWDQLRRSVDELLPLLDEAEASLAIEPFYTHVLGDVARLTQFCAELKSPYLGIVLDPPNLLPPATWDSQAKRITALTTALAPYTRLVHLKDMRLDDGRLELPGPGLGLLDYPALLAAIERAQLYAPLIIEHVTIEQAAAARRFVLSQRK